MANAAPRTLTRPELTAALAARQLLLERSRIAPAEAIRRLTPLQAQDVRAPYVSLAARLDGFSRGDLEAAINGRAVVKTTLMRLTLHLAAAEDYPAYAQLSRQPRMRRWRKRYAHLHEPTVEAELREWLREPRSNDDIRERIGAYEGVGDGDWEAVQFARNLLPLVQLPPAGLWAYRGRPRFALHPVPLPDPVAAAELVLRRYLAAFGPASRRDIAAWAGVAQYDLAAALERLRTVSFSDESGTELLDLPGLPLPPAATKLPVRLLPRWEQSLLAYDDRSRILAREVQALNLTLSGDQTVTVDGRIAASWLLERGRARVRVNITPHVAIRRPARSEIRAEALRAAAFCEPDARGYEVAWS
jgi:hypothetical protein